MRRERLNEIVPVPSAVLSVAAATLPKEALKAMRANCVHHLAVTLDGCLVGVVSDRDLLAGVDLTGTMDRTSPSTVADHMVHLRRGVSADTRLVDLLDLMEETGASGLPIETNAGVVGFVTERDLILTLRALLSASLESSGTSPLSEVVLSHPLLQGSKNRASRPGNRGRTPNLESKNGNSYRDQE